MFRESTSPTAYPNEAILIAAINVSLFAGTTRPIIYDRLHCDSCPDLKVAHVLPNLFDRAREFVA